MNGDEHHHETYPDYGVGDISVQGSPQEAQWLTLSTPISVDHVRGLLRKAIALKVSGVSGAEGPSGFVLVAKEGRREIACEVNLTGWAEGTQLHIAQSRNRRSGAQVFVSWLNQALLEPK